MYSKRMAESIGLLILGVGLSKGELFFILDSDDILPNNALELVVETYQPIKHDISFAGV